MSLLTAIKTQAQITDTVLISFSMGKDSIATMDLCFKYFKRVQPFFMYMVPNLEFQEEALGKYERHYNTKIIRVPHFETSDFYRYGSFRDPDFSVPRVKIKWIYDYLRSQTGIYWISGGEKINDSMVRRAMLKNTGSINEKRDTPLDDEVEDEKDKLAEIASFEGKQGEEGLEKFNQKKADFRHKDQDNTIINFYTKVVFPDNDTKKAFYRKANIPANEEFITFDQVKRYFEKE